MKPKRFPWKLIPPALLLVAGTVSAEVILQNGTDGYNGCRDALIANMDYLTIMDMENADNDIAISFDDVAIVNSMNFGSEKLLGTHFCPS